MDDVELMVVAVRAAPSDETARGALADAIAERGGDFGVAAALALGVAVCARIDALVRRLDETVEAHWREMGYTFAPPPTHRAEYVSDRWCKIVRRETGGDGQPGAASVAAFVCLSGGRTKALGMLKAGDIHKPASWKAPAKHARGSVLADDFGGAISPAGYVKHLR